MARTVTIKRGLPFTLRFSNTEKLKRHNPKNKKIPRPPKPPRLRKPATVLDERFITVEKGDNSFDYRVRISTINKGRPILVPLGSYRHANRHRFTGEPVVPRGVKPELVE